MIASVLLSLSGVERTQGTNVLGNVTISEPLGDQKSGNYWIRSTIVGKSGAKGNRPLSYTPLGRCPSYWELRYINIYCWSLIDFTSFRFFVCLNFSKLRIKKKILSSNVIKLKSSLNFPHCVPPDLYLKGDICLFCLDSAEPRLIRLIFQINTLNIPFFFYFGSLGNKAILKNVPL